MQCALVYSFFIVTEYEVRLIVTDCFVRIIIIIIIYHALLFAKYSQTNIESMKRGWAMHAARTKRMKNAYRVLA